MGSSHHITSLVKAFPVFFPKAIHPNNRNITYPVGWHNIVLNLIVQAHEAKSEQPSTTEICPEETLDSFLKNPDAFIRDIPNIRVPCVSCPANPHVVCRSCYGSGVSKTKILHICKNPWNHFKVLQIKEKFGSMRFYYRGGEDWFSRIVSYAEQLTWYTCKLCSRPGQGGICPFHRADLYRATSGRYSSLEPYASEIFKTAVNWTDSPLDAQEKIDQIIEICAKAYEEINRSEGKLT